MLECWPGYAALADLLQLLFGSRIADALRAPLTGSDGAVSFAMPALVTTARRPGFRADGMPGPASITSTTGRPDHCR